MASAAACILQGTQHCVQIERGRLLARWELYEGIDLSSHNILHHVHDVGMRNNPVPVCIRALVGPLEWVTPEMEHLRGPQLHERLKPAYQPLRPLFHEHDFPVAHPDRQDIAVVTDIEEELPGAFLHLAAQVRQQIIAIDMNFEGLVAGLVASESFDAMSGFPRQPEV